MRVRIVKGWGKFHKGQTVVIDRKAGLQLIKDGIAILTKDMTESDYKITSDEVQADGKSFIIRTNGSSIS